jgi:hypothetical protein
MMIAEKLISAMKKVPKKAGATGQKIALRNRYIRSNRFRRVKRRI